MENLNLNVLQCWHVDVNVI